MARNTNLKYILFMTYTEIKGTIQAQANAEKALLQTRFFKTKKGQYAYGDIFIGVSNPQLHVLAKKYKNASLDTIALLLQDAFHEVRVLALFILVLQFEKGDMALQKDIYTLYLRYINFVNNWDLVDCSAPKIIGAYLIDKDKKTLYQLSKSNDLWQERIAIVATLFFIRKGIYEPTINIAISYLNHKHDLIHKATGWMLREIGKKNEALLINFLEQYQNNMPRTMYRYAIEKLKK